MNPTAYGRSLIRTIVPIVVGALVGWLATRGIEVDAAVIIPAVDGIVAALYYAAIRAAEQKWPSAGWLLGAPGAPSYGSAVVPPGIVVGGSESDSGANSDLPG
jgi:ABC-type phosphate/phosphonate transport system permease subunit